MWRLGEGVDWIGEDGGVGGDVGLRGRVVCDGGKRRKERMNGLLD